MSISGSLRDVTVADVIQFIQLGRRDGSLLLDRDGENASLSFDNGRLILARAPGVPNLSELIALRGWLPDPVLATVRDEQLAAREPMRFGQILVRKGLLDFVQVRELLEEQVRRALEVVTRWDRGSFEFVAETTASPDGFRVELAEAVGYEPPALLLEAAQIFEQREQASSPDIEMRRELELDPPRSEHAEVWLVTRDQGGAERLAAGIRALGANVVALPPESLARRARSGSSIPGVLLFDLGSRDLSLAEIEEARRLAKNGVVVAALAATNADAAELFTDGMQAVLPASPEAISAFVSHSVPSLRDLARREGAAVRRLRRVYDDLRDGFRSTTVTLHLMQLIAERFERAVLFLVRKGDCVALGAFGDDASGNPLATSTRGLRLSIETDDAVALAVGGRRVVRLPDSDVTLPASLAVHLGSLAGRSAFVFPVTGTEQVIAVVYADSSESGGLGEEVELLELAASQVGVALENELLRAKISRGQA
jgi:GAF domain-containing protein